MTACRAPVEYVADVLLGRSWELRVVVVIAMGYESGVIGLCVEAGAPD